MDPDEIADLLVSLADELEETADAHRVQMVEAASAIDAAEHRGISRGMLFVATKIRTAVITQ